MTVEKCKNLCLGFTYAGVQFSGECFCGNTAPTITAQNCNMECSGNDKQICGGVWAMNVYYTKEIAVPTQFDIMGDPTIDGKFSFLDDRTSIGRSEDDHFEEFSEYEYVETKGDEGDEGEIYNTSVGIIQVEEF